MSRVAPAAALAVALAAVAARGAPGTAQEPVTGGPRGTEEPLAVRGGVFVAPLSPQPGARWPEAIDLVLADGRRIRGTVACVRPVAVTTPRRWTDEPAGLVVGPLETGDDPPRAARQGSALVVARLPADGSGPVRVAGRTLDPWWVDPPPPVAGAAVLLRRESPDLPDPDTPLAWWRWVLVAQQRGVTAPAPDYGDQLSVLIAEHHADRWRVGLARLGAVSPGVASACRELLTRTCRDGERSVAAWVSDPVRTGALLNILLSRGLQGRSLAHAALAWADSQEPLLVWAEGASLSTVTLALANPTPQTRVVTFRWVDLDKVPVAAEAAPGVVTRVQVDRPRRLPGASEAIEPPAVDLLIEAGAWERRLSFYRPYLVAAPPGPFFPPLHPPLSLLEVQTGLALPVPASRTTLAHLRRLGGRWEVFFECHREALPTGEAGPAGEAVAVVLGDEGPDGAAGAAAQVTLEIPEQGAPRVLRGADDPALQVHRRSVGDRWYCRIVLPEAWLPADPAQPLRVGLMRRHGGDESVETGPYRCLPWAIDPGRAIIDLSRWDE
jgi:hypothetical protein